MFKKVFLFLFFCTLAQHGMAVENPIISLFVAQRPIYKAWPQLLKSFSRNPMFTSLKDDAIYKFKLNFADVSIYHNSGLIHLSYNIGMHLFEEEYELLIQDDIKSALSTVKKKYPHFSINMNIEIDEYMRRATIDINRLPESIETLTFLSELGKTL